MKDTGKAVAVFAFLLVVALIAFAGPVAQAAGWQDFWDDTRFHLDVWINDDLTVDDAITAADITITDDFVSSDQVQGADLRATDDLFVADDAIVTGTFTAGDFAMLDINSDSAITITPGVEGAAVTYTPTTSLVRLNAAAAVTIALGLAEAGTVVWLTNDDNVNMLFPDSGNQALGGARTVTQNDTLQVISVGTAWREVSFVAN